jgi:drug/metabolite transporter (DMT)-like permease
VLRNEWIVPELTLSPVGLLLATATSVSNVLADVSRKKVVDRNELVAATFWIRIFAALVFTIALIARVFTGTETVIRDGGPLFGIAAFTIPPIAVFLVYLTIDVALIGCAQLLLMRALQVSSMSLCIPFMAFTPVFLIGTGYVMIGELPSWIKLMGVCLIVVGSLVMHRRLFAEGWVAPVRAILREKGSRYILLVALILSITNPIEKRLVTMSDPLTQAFGYCIGLCILFAILVWARHADCRAVMKSTPRWAILAGVMDAAALLLQLFTYSYLAVVITISIKRAGIVLSVLAGWLIFREREITDKLIASSVMLGGVLILYLPLDAMQALVLAALVLAGTGVALYATHPRGLSEKASG